MPPPGSKERACFIISPIGDLNSDTHKRSELVRTHIILPATKNAGYTEDKVIRADQIPQPGIITSQVIQHLYDDELVIADLTDHNANVFYELAIRHATRKAVVLLIQKGQRIPFDVAPSRVIHYDLSDWTSPEVCAEELAKQIEFALNDPLSVDNPVSAGMDFRAFSGSSDPVAQIATAIVPRLEALEFSIQNIQAALNTPSLQPGRWGVPAYSGFPLGAIGPVGATGPADPIGPSLSQEIMDRMLAKGKAPTNYLRKAALRSDEREHTEPEPNSSGD